MRVVLDTNVVVSRVVVPVGIPAQIHRYWGDKAFEVIVSEPMLEEYRKVLAYKRIRARHHLTDDEIDEVITAFREPAVLAIPEAALDVIKDDPDDNKVIECAVSGGADYIVSGDDHLLKLEEYQGIRILSPAVFLSLLKQQASDAEPKPLIPDP